MKKVIILLLVTMLSAFAETPGVVKSVSSEISIHIEDLIFRDNVITIQYQIKNLGSNQYKLNKDVLEKPDLTLSATVEGKRRVSIAILSERKWSSDGSESAPNRWLKLEKKQSVTRRFAVFASGEDFPNDPKKVSNISLQLEFQNVISLPENGKMVSITLFSDKFTGLLKNASSGDR